MGFHCGSPTLFSFVLIAEMAEFVFFSEERAKCLGILMVAELADYAFSARFTSVISFVMVAAFAADAQCLCAIC